MKAYKILLVLLLLLISTAAPAQGLLSQLSRDHNNLAINNVIFTLHLIVHTYAGVSVQEEDFIGTSETAPCSDLKSIGINNYTVRGSLFYSDYDHAFAYASHDIAHEFGKGLTCIKSNLYGNGQLLSTGNIELTWDRDAFAYVAAKPNTVTFDFGKDSTS